jgi:hypothetical protein
MGNTTSAVLDNLVQGSNCEPCPGPLEALTPQRERTVGGGVME